MRTGFYAHITVLLNYLVAILLANITFTIVLFTLEEMTVIFLIPTIIFDFSVVLLFTFGYKKLLRKVYLDEDGIQEKVLGKLITRHSWQDFNSAKVIIKYNSRYLLLKTNSKSEILFNFRKSRLKVMRKVCKNNSFLDKLESLDNSLTIRFKKGNN